MKGTPVSVFRTPRSFNSLSDIAVDCRQSNAIWAQVLVSGTGPLATISLEGSDQEGGNYLPLDFAAAKRTGINADISFDCPIGAPWVKARIADIAGTYGNNQGYSIILTPYQAASMADDMAAFNLPLLPLETGTNADRQSDWIYTPKAVKGLVLTVSIKAIAGGSPTFTPQIKWRTPVIQNDIVYWGGAGLTSEGHAQYVIYPGASGGDVTEAIGLPMPPYWQLYLDYSGSGTATTYANATYLR